MSTRPPLGCSVPSMVQRYIGTEYDKVKLVADNIEYIKDIAEGIDRDNLVSDLRDELEPRIETSEKNIEDLSAQSFEALRRSYAEAGFNLVDGSFEDGGTLTSTSGVLLHKATGATYSWSGSFPKVVAAGATPATSGGIGAGAWVYRTQEVLRNELTLNGSSIDVLFRIGKKMVLVTESRFTGGVDITTGVHSAVSAIQAAIDYVASVSGIS